MFTLLALASAITTIQTVPTTPATSWVARVANTTKANTEKVIGKGEDVQIGYYDKFGSQVRNVSELAGKYSLEGLKKVTVGFSFLPDVDSEDQLANIINVEFAKQMSWKEAFKALKLDTKGVVILERPTDAEVSADCSLKNIPGLPKGWYGQFFASKTITVLNLVHGEFVSDKAKEWLKKP